MKKNQTQIVSFILVIMMMFIGAVAIGVADEKLTEEEVRTNLTKIQQEQYPDGSFFESEGFAGASTCYGFAKKVQYLIFGNIVSWSYDGTSSDGLNLVDRVDYPFSADKMKTLFAQAKVGDLIQMDVGNIKCQHSMIFGGLTSNGFIVYDANWEPYNEVDLRTESYNAYQNRDHAHISLLRNTRYSDAPADNEKPVISNLEILNQTDLSYTVKATVSDNVGVTSVKMPTWTSANGQDDLIWHDAAVSGNVATCTINISDHNKETGEYITHVYVYDKAGNYATTGTTVNMKQKDSVEADTKGFDEKGTTDTVQKVPVKEKVAEQHADTKAEATGPLEAEKNFEESDSQKAMNTVEKIDSSQTEKKAEEKVEVVDSSKEDENSKIDVQTEKTADVNQTAKPQASEQKGETIEKTEESYASIENDDPRQKSETKTKSNVNTGYGASDFCIAAVIALVLIMAVRLIALMVERKNN